MGLLLLPGCLFDPSGLALPDRGVDRGRDGVRRDAPLDRRREVRPDQRSPDLGPPLTPLAPDDGRLWVGITPPTLLRLFTWSAASGAWVVEQSVPQLADKVRWLAGHATATAGAEHVLVKTESASGAALGLHRYAAGSWHAELARSTPSSPVDTRDLALAAERSSGDLLLVFGDGSARLQYSVRSGQVWTTPQPVPLNDGPGLEPDVTTGKVLWVELVPRPNSDELLLLFGDANADLGTLRWDGSTWDPASATLLEGNVKTNPQTGLMSNRAFAGAYAALSGDALVAFGLENQDGFGYRVRTAAGWGAREVVAAPGGKVQFVDLASDPQSNRVAGVFLDLGVDERLGLGVWDGAQWVGTKEYPAKLRDVNNTARGDFPAAVTWVGTTGKALAVFAAEKDGFLDWYSWSTAAAGEWVAGTAVTVPTKGWTESVLLRSLRVKDQVLAVLSDSKSAVYALRFDGAAWSVVGTSPLAAPVLTSSQPFALEIR